VWAVGAPADGFEVTLRLRRGPAPVKVSQIDADPVPPVLADVLRRLPGWVTPSVRTMRRRHLDL